MEDRGNEKKWRTRPRVRSKWEQKPLLLLLPLLLLRRLLLFFSFLFLFLFFYAKKRRRRLLARHVQGSLSFTIVTSCTYEKPQTANVISRLRTRRVSLSTKPKPCNTMDPLSYPSLSLSLYHISTSTSSLSP